MEDYHHDFNEDELINDYIQDNHDDYPEYDEEEYYDAADESKQQQQKLPHPPPNNATSNNANSNNEDGDNGMDIEDGSIDNKEQTIPSVIISTKTSNEPSSSSSSSNLYSFERYSGLSAWRSSNNNNSTNNKYGATTMEATSWKKKKKFSNDNDDGDESEDYDDLDNKPIKRNNDTGNKLLLLGPEAQLVKMHQLSHDESMGRSWGRNSGSSSTELMQNYEQRFMYKETALVPEEQNSVMITVGNGTTVNIPLKNNNSNNSLRGEYYAHNGGDDGMATTDELVRRADILRKRGIKRQLEKEERMKRETKRSKKNNTVVQEEDDVELNENEETDPLLLQDDTNTKQTQHQQQIIATSIKKHRREMQHRQRLWVDKHAPTSISHLLSDERTNREVIRALKLWDPYVFRRDAPKRPVGWNNSFGGGGNNSKYERGEKVKQKRKKGGGDNTNEEENDNGENGNNGKEQKADVRPEESSRVILLSGPPGVGKTTLAHIVCRHAGYRPIEVNASDERSASALTERVTRAMESSTLILGGEEETSNGKVAGGKPNCIILDEVDGADAKNAISAIVDIVRAEIPKSGGKGKKSKSARSTTTYLRRPIILICNHKHAPALRPILPYARQFDVQPPNPERLTSRLRAVLSAEKMSVVGGGMLLHRLVASTGGDVRSCLYALQFASARAREVAMKKREREGIVGGGDGNVVVDISSTLMAALGDSGNGMKDMQSDVSNTVATIFRKDKSKRSNKRQKGNGGKVSTDLELKGVNNVLKTVEHFGDHSKTLDCLFMNVNRVAYVDPTLDRCAAAFDWLSGADMYRSQKSSVAMNNNAEHHSMQKYYMPSAAAAIHLLCCIETRPDLTFSTRELGDLHYKGQANTSLIHRFVEGFSPRARSGIGGGTDVVVSDMIPYGLWLLSAGNGKYSLSKPASSVDILSSEEKLAFSSHVATLRALGLTYVKDDRSFNDFKPNNAHDNVRLEPDIDKLVKFEHVEGCYSIERKQVPPVLRELLAHGATLAALRERELEAKLGQEISAPAKEQSQKETAIKPIKSKSTDVKADKRMAARNFLNVGAAKAKEAKSARRAARVGFDRSKKVKLSNTGSGIELSKVIRFKFQKGFTQAVRAPCQMEDLL